MARLVDAASFLKAYAFEEGAACRLRLYVKDEYAAWNQGLYDLEIGAKGQAEVTFSPCEPPEAPEDGIVCGIGVLTAILLGYERPDLKADMGRLAGCTEAVRLLEGAVPRRQTYLLDFF